MSALYVTKVKAVGGRHGSIRSDDGLLELKLALPKTLGGKGDATNPEQLFAGGYAACFENALLRVSQEAGRRLADDDVEITAEVGLSRNEKMPSCSQLRLRLPSLALTSRQQSRLSAPPTPSAPIRMPSRATSMW
ncbi:Ohr family peroxiredoxin [Dyella flava]|uniref:Ohr family peroxiredoxin n=1 Tax=Dyella flava TaxID=1920170 RepID=UPI001EF87C83|nr:Ohr family peroxiredoxin [Dyella flava]GLQ51860.1 hypothetical protein GCM10010872_33090 [Dyella flava]